MTRAKCKIEEEGALRRGSRVVAQISNRLVHEIAAEVIFAARLEPNRAIVPVEIRIPLIGQGAVKSVPAGKSAAQRPIVMRTGGTVVGASGAANPRVPVPKLLVRNLSPTLAGRDLTCIRL